MIFSFVLLDQSTPATAGPEYGGPLTFDWLQSVAAALRVQLNVYVAAYWGGACTVLATHDLSEVAPGAALVPIVDARPDQPDAVAAHGATDTGLPIGFVSRAMCRSLDDLSVGASHELAEIWVDPDINDWCDDGTGFSVAKEICDPVQGNRYRIGDIAVSDFVLPPWMTIGAPGPYSYMRSREALPTDLLVGVPAAPFAVAAGGYYVRREVGTGQVEVFGQIPDAHLAEKLKATSRSYRRGLRAANLGW